MKKLTARIYLYRLRWEKREQQQQSIAISYAIWLIHVHVWVVGAQCICMCIVYCIRAIFYALIEPRLINALQIKPATWNIHRCEWADRVLSHEHFFCTHVCVWMYDVRTYVCLFTFLSSVNKNEITKWLIAFPLVSWIVWQYSIDAVFIKSHFSRCVHNMCVCAASIILPMKAHFITDLHLYNRNYIFNYGDSKYIGWLHWSVNVDQFFSPKTNIRDFSPLRKNGRWTPTMNKMSFS